MPEHFAPDADALINIHRHFPEELELLHQLARHGRLHLVGGVYREILRGTDRLRVALERWVQAGWEAVEVDRDEALRDAYARIELTYGRSVRVGKQVYQGFWTSPAGRRAADGQLVAAAKVRRWTVASDDKVVRAACLLEDIPCVHWQEFLRRVRPPTPIPLALDTGPEG